jgi:hypothetical protein
MLTPSSVAIYDIDRPYSIRLQGEWRRASSLTIPAGWRGMARLRNRGQNVRMAISAGASSSASISGSSRLSVMDVPAMSSDVQ